VVVKWADIFHSLFCVWAQYCKDLWLYSISCLLQIKSPSLSTSSSAEDCKCLCCQGNTWHTALKYQTYGAGSAPKTCIKAITRVHPTFTFQFPARTKKLEVSLKPWDNTMQMCGVPYRWNTCLVTRWFKYDRDDLCVNKLQSVPVIFEPPCIIQFSVHLPPHINKRENMRNKCTMTSS
jgi:hypothetical protein